MSPALKIRRRPMDRSFAVFEQSKVCHRDCWKRLSNGRHKKCHRVTRRVYKQANEENNWKIWPGFESPCCVLVTTYYYTFVSVVVVMFEHISVICWQKKMPTLSTSPRCRTFKRFCRVIPWRGHRVRELKLHTLFLKMGQPWPLFLFIFVLFTTRWQI